MNLEKIESNLKKLVSNIDKENFIYDFLLAYGLPKSSINRLKKGDYNKSKNDGEIIWTKKIYFKIVSENEDVHDVIDEISKTNEIEKNKIRLIIVTDFINLLSLDLKTRDTLDIDIIEIDKNGHFFLPLIGQEKFLPEKESEADIKAAYKMGKLYDNIISNNKNILEGTKERHGLNIFFTRVLFCFFAEDANIFDKGLFTSSIKSYTNPDNNELEGFLEKLFKVLNTESRNDLPNYLKKFPYVNGGLFKNDYKIPSLTKEFRKIMIECGDLDWNSINPDIFGSMMQAVVQHGERKELGMHYTSSANILKSIKPLFLNSLNEEFNEALGNKKKLNKILSKLYNINIFDPACGSGNFLVVTYKELYKLEIEILKELKSIDTNDWLLANSGIELSQFFGIELDDYAHEMAKLSLWIVQHQMNVVYSEILGEQRPTLPLSEPGNIVCANSTSYEWNKICPRNKDKHIYLVGNPPYSGAKLQTSDQKKDLASVFKNFKSYKNLDYIACWFYLASKYIKDLNASFSFVSTSSISQGEQVSLLWPSIFNLGLEISFGYKPFEWSNHAKGNAGVTCVIIGIQNISNKNKKLIFQKTNQALISKNISPYLIDLDPSIIINRETSQIAGLPEMLMGNMPRDGSNFILEEKDYKDLLNESEKSKKFIKKYLGSNELIKGHKRWCLWIDDKDLDEACEIDFIKKRLSKVKNFRENSKAKSTIEKAKYFNRFAQIQHAPEKAIVVPKVTTSKRDYLPIDFVDEDTVVSDLCFAIYKPEVYLFGLLSSRMHIVWLRTVSGRFRDGYRYSSTLCYNSFVPPDLDEKKKSLIENCVFEILEQREIYSDKSLFDLYDPENMPLLLKKAHTNLDLTIETLYRNGSFGDDDERLKYLFKLFAKKKNKEILI
jgi:hypothetical protein